MKYTYDYQLTVLVYFRIFTCIQFILSAYVDDAELCPAAVPSCDVPC